MRVKPTLIPRPFFVRAQGAPLRPAPRVLSVTASTTGDVMPSSVGATTPVTAFFAPTAPGTAPKMFLMMFACPASGVPSTSSPPATSAGTLCAPAR